jgi:phenylpropionate dioxygenase-like ring-hydroxylating dioxygenase large terminal subunit
LTGHIDPDIRRAATLPAEVYSDPRWFHLSRERIFSRSWQLVGDTDSVRVPGLDRVEREDEAVVESVQRGVRSRLYHRGRYSPTREQGPHHFHRLLERFLREGI